LDPANEKKNGIIIKRGREEMIWEEKIK